MTEEEMKTLLAERDAEIEKLKADKHTALGEKNKANAAAKAAQDAADEAAAEALAKTGDIEAIKSQLETKHNKALKALQDQLDSSTQKLSGMLIDDTITKSLVDNNVPKHMHAPLAAMFKMNSKLNDGVAMFGDTPLADHLPAYFKSDEGKAFVTAPVNVGTGSTGVRNPNANTHGFTKENIDTKIYELMKIAKTDPDSAKAILGEVGRSDLAVDL